MPQRYQQHGQKLDLQRYTPSKKHILKGTYRHSPTDTGKHSR